MMKAQGVSTDHARVSILVRQWRRNTKPSTLMERLIAELVPDSKPNEARLVYFLREKRSHAHDCGT